MNAILEFFWQIFENLSGYAIFSRTHVSGNAPFSLQELESVFLKLQYTRALPFGSVYPCHNSVWNQS